MLKQKCHNNLNRHGGQRVLTLTWINYQKGLTSYCLVIILFSPDKVPGCINVLVLQDLLLSKVFFAYKLMFAIFLLDLFLCHFNTQAASV